MVLHIQYFLQIESVSAGDILIAQLTESKKNRDTTLITIICGIYTHFRNN